MLHKNIPYRRSMEKRHQDRLKFLADTLSYYPSGAYKVEKDGKCWYRRYYRHRGSSYLKSQANRTFRRRKISSIEDAPKISTKGYYRKVYEYWWQLY